MASRGSRDPSPPLPPWRRKQEHVGRDSLTLRLCNRCGKVAYISKGRCLNPKCVPSARNTIAQKVEASCDALLLRRGVVSDCSSHAASGTVPGGLSGHSRRSETQEEQGQETCTLVGKFKGSAAGSVESCDALIISTCVDIVASLVAKRCIETSVSHNLPCVQC